MSRTGVRYALQMAARHSYIVRAGSHFQRFCLQASLLPFKFLFQDISNLANAVSGKSQVFCPSDEQCHPPGNCQNCVDRTYGFSW